MEKRFESIGSLVEVSFVDEHFRSCPNALWRRSHNRPSAWSLCGVKKTCRPGVTRDVKGGIAAYGFSEAHRMWSSCHCSKALLSYRKVQFICEFLSSWWWKFTSLGSSFKLNVMRCSFAASSFLMVRDLSFTSSRSGLNSSGFRTIYVILCFIVDIKRAIGLSRRVRLKLQL
jgi:hypothetical protein